MDPVELDGSGRRHRRAVLALVAGAVAVGALIAHTRAYPHFFFDDSFISLRYADRLRSGLGLTWTDGERVEGYSNLLWVLLIAAIGLVSDGLVQPTRVLGVACASLGIAALVYAHRPRRGRELVAPLFGGLAVALSGCVAAWAVGGLEQPLLLGLVGWAAALLLETVDAGDVGWRRMGPAGLLLGLACWTRPDGPLFAVGFCLGIVLALGAGRRSLAAAARLAALPALFVAGQTAFRRAYYDAWLPNTSTKLVTSSAHLSLGRHYVAADAGLRFGLLYAAAFALLLAFGSDGVRRRVSVVGPPLAVWLLYVVAIGGGFMPQHRHLVVAVLLAAMVAAEAPRWMVRQRSGWPAVAWVGAPLLLLHLGIAQQRDPAVRDANITFWYWEGRPVGRFFRSAFGARDPLLAVDAAGALPYFFEGRALDMLGLNDRHIATHPPGRLGSGWLAHELGDGRYVLDRKPDLVVFHLPRGRERALWRSGLEMQASLEFHRLYQLLRYRTREPDSVDGLVWIRKEDGPLAIRRSRTAVVIPGYLLGSRRATRVVLDPEGRVAALATARQPAQLADVAVGAGRWRMSVDASGPAYAVVSVRRTRSEPLSNLDEVDFTLVPGRARVSLEVVPVERAGPTYVYQVSLRRL